MAIKRDTKSNGDNILYHFFQKQLMENDSDLAKSFIVQAINALGIWIHPNFYLKLPVILPFVVRDTSCRNNKGKDEWASPNDKGFLRDDNSLVKGIIKSMQITNDGPSLYKEGITIGNGFVASHVWRELTPNTELASRNPWLNTFVPNLVWLPKQISKMTDREGGFAQLYVQALSRHIYQHYSFNSPLEERIKHLWSRLPKSDCFKDKDLPDSNCLNFFKSSPNSKLIENRIKKIEQVVVAINMVLANEPLKKKVIASRYTDGLPYVNSENLSLLANNLQKYLDELK